MSCFLTLLLSITRMIALVNPLYIIKKKFLRSFLLVLSAVLLCTAIGKFFLLKDVHDENYSDEAILKGIRLFLKKAVDPIPKSETDVKGEFAYGYKNVFYVQMAEFILIAVVVIIVAICSGLTIKSLKSPMTEVSVASGNERGNSQNRRATIMILLLSFVFILINGCWIVTNLAINIEVIQRVEEAKVAEMTFLTLVLMPANSIANPLIYISRNTGLKEYTRSFVIKLRKFVFRCAK